MKISFDPPKREKTLQERGLDFADALKVFAGSVYEAIDDRFEYDEERSFTAGYLDERMVIVVWTERGDTRHIISMRKANDREQRRYRIHMD